MSYRLGKTMDEKWIARERAKTEDQIMRLLLKVDSLWKPEPFDIGLKREVEEYLHGKA